MPKSKRRSGKVPKSDRPCTYELGYVRQDLYACRKCIKESNGTLSGFCRGCKETCHAGHAEEVIELYTKRNFRCDCGNSRMNSKCSLTVEKDDLNVENEPSYSHNFEGRYCRCDREYDYNLAMAQCAMCEDWFHEECYKTDAETRAKGSEDDDFFQIEYELTCKDCVKKLPLLGDYYEQHHAWVGDNAPLKSGRKSKCVRPKRTDIKSKPGTMDYVWRQGFRLALCRCPECMTLYKNTKVAYLVDRADFVGASEQEDPNLLQATDDAEILNDVIEDENEKQKKKLIPMFFDEERIPRKPLPPKAQDPISANPAADSMEVDNIGQKLSEEQRLSIRTRINDFLRHSIETNGGNLDKVSMEGYLADLYADCLNSFTEKLDS